MAESTQHRLDRVRPPRVQITYDVEVGTAIEMKELPFVVGIIANVSGQPSQELPKIKDRKFVGIDRDNFEKVMSACYAHLALRVPNTVHPNEKDVFLNCELFFSKLSDFEPLQIIRQVPVLNTLYTTRSYLKDLMTKLDGNDVLEHLLNDYLSDRERALLLRKSVSSEESSDQELVELRYQLFKVARLARDTSQEDFAKELINQLLSCMEAFDQNVSDVIGFINSQIAALDQVINKQLNTIMHDSAFLKLEGSWRGLHYLVFNTETNATLRLRLLNISKEELLSDLEHAIEFDQSYFFKKVYEAEYGTFGGTPYSCLIGDYEFTRHPMDIELLEKISNVAAAAHAPFISAAHPTLFDLDTFEELGAPRDLAKIFDSLEMIKWESFRNSEDSRYIALTLPRVLMRLPYGIKTLPAEGVNFEEEVTGTDSKLFCWTNAAYILGERITNAFAHYGWTAAIRGVEGGGIVEGLPGYTFRTTEGDLVLKCPTEITITDRREKELSDLGFIAICHCKGHDYAAFFGGQTVQRPKVYNLSDATANANLSTRLPYILAASRFAHYIKVIMRDKIGSFMTKDNVATYLNNWIANYVLLNDDASQSVKAHYPLREARIDVYDVPGKPGVYTSIVYLRPHFQMEELKTSIRLVATLPPPASA